MRPPTYETAAGPGARNSRTDGGNIPAETTASAKGVSTDTTTSGTLVAILAARYGLSLPVARTVKEAAFGLGGGHA